MTRNNTKMVHMECVFCFVFERCTAHICLNLQTQNVLKPNGKYFKVKSRYIYIYLLMQDMRVFWFVVFQSLHLHAKCDIGVNLWNNDSMMFVDVIFLCVHLLKQFSFNRYTYDTHKGIIVSWCVMVYRLR